MAKQASSNHSFTIRMSALAASLAAATLTGCATVDLNSSLLTTGSTDKPEVPAAKTAAKAAADGTSKSSLDDLMRRHADAPQEPKAAVAYAYGLKATGQANEAITVLGRLATAPQPDRDVVGALGLMELERGQTKKAQQLLTQASSGGTPNWRYLSGLGVAHSIQGRQARAQAYFKKALEASPANPSVLNNLAVSYMLDRKVEQAETMLLQAKGEVAGPAEVGQNLALAGRLKEQVALTADTIQPLDGLATAN